MTEKQFGKSAIKKTPRKNKSSAKKQKGGDNNGSGKLKLTSAEVAAVYEKMDRNKSATARHLGVTVNTITHHLKQAGIMPKSKGAAQYEQNKKRKEKEKAKNKPKTSRKRKSKKDDDVSPQGAAKAVVVTQSAGSPINQQQRAHIYQQELMQAIDGVNVLSGMGEQVAKIGRISDMIEAEMEKKEKLSPFHVELYLKTLREGRSAMELASKIKKDLFDAEGTKAFMLAVVEILKSEVPDVQQRLFAKLCQLGVGDQSYIINPVEEGASND